MLKITQLTALSLALLLLFAAAPVAAQQGGQQQYTWIMGKVTQVSQNGMQIQDQSGMTNNVTFTPQTVVTSLAEDPKTATQRALTDLRQGDMVLIASTPQGGGAFLAAMIGYLHAGEKLHPGWQGGGGGQSTASTTPGTSSPGSTGSSPYGNTGSSPYGTTGSSPYGSTGSSPYGNTGSQPTGNTGASPYGNTGSSPYGTTTPGTTGPGMPAGGGIAVNDPNGHFSFTLPQGWTAGGTQQGVQMYFKQGAQGMAGCMAGSTTLPSPAQQADIMTISQSIAQNYETQMQQSGYKKLGLSPVNVGGIGGACLKYSYNGQQGGVFVVEEYYFKVGTAGVTVHLESLQETFEAFRPDFQQILAGMKLR